MMLIFQGAGIAQAEISKKSGFGNCRLKTVIKNNDGRLIFIEVRVDETYQHSPWVVRKGMREGVIFFDIGGVFFADKEDDRRKNYSPEFSELRLTTVFFATPEKLLEWVNKNLNCSFTGYECNNDGLRVNDEYSPLCGGMKS